MERSLDKINRSPNELTASGEIGPKLKKEINDKISKTLMLQIKRPFVSKESLDSNLAFSECAKP